MKRGIGWMTLFILLLALACTQNVTNQYQNESNGRVIGYVHGVVTDAHTNARLDSILVTWMVRGQVKTTKTNHLGYYAINKLPPGDYEITFSSTEGYAMSRTWVHVPNQQEVGGHFVASDQDFHYSVTKDIPLYALNARATGKVYVVQHAEQTHPAVQATVVADFTALDISPARFTATTNASGVYTFSNLPSALPSDEVLFYTLPFSDTSGTYAVSMKAVYGLIYNGTRTIEPFFLEVGGEAPVIVRNNFELRELGVNENIRMTFSKAMAPATFKIRLTTLELQELSVNVTWSNNIILTIDPILTLQANTTYRLEIDGFSQDNHRFNRFFWIRTQAPLRLVSSNIQQVDGQMLRAFPIDSNIELVFSRPVNLTHPLGYLKLYESSNTLRVSVTIRTPETDPTRVIIDPDNPLEPGLLYTLEYRVYSTIEGDFTEGQIPFMTSSAVRLPAQITGFETTTPQRDFDTQTLAFRWNTLREADRYFIYARDNGVNTDRVRVGGPYSPQDYLIRASGELTLPPQFDAYRDDDLQTPFANGTRITFFVVAENDAGLGPFSSGLTLGDNVTPRVVSWNQTGSANNIRNGTTRTFRIHFRASEYLADSVPTWQILEQGTSNTMPDDPDYVIPDANVTFAWDNDRRGGTFTITVPANQNGAGDMFVIGNLYDTSNNQSATTFSYEMRGADNEITGFTTLTTSRDYNTTSLSFSWNWIEGAANYYIFARDNGANTAWSQIGGAHTSTSATVVIPARFDSRAGDAIQTPFADGTQITFVVVGTGTAGFEAYSRGVRLGDNVSPSITGFSQNISADNSTGTATRLVLVRFDANEYLADAVTPTGVISGLTPQPTISFAWDGNYRGGTFTIPVPPGSNWSGYNFVVQNLRDTSGNTATGPWTHPLN